MAARSGIGLLYDFPQGDDLFADVVAARARRSRGDRAPRSRRSSSSSDQRAGCPSGSEHDVKRAFAELDDEGVVAIIGPSISDNALIVAPLCDAARIPAINYSGGERTRSQWMFHYQVGSLEEEPPRARGAHGRARACAAPRSCSTSRPSVAATPSASKRRAARLGLEVTGTASISSLAENAERSARATARPAIPTCSSTSVSASSSRAVALARESLGWDVPVLANSALMFGYARPDWRDGYAGWEYIDTIADDNRRARRCAELSPHAAGGPIGCAAYDIGRLLGEAIAAVGAPDPRRHRRRAAPGEAAPGDERLRRNADGLRDVWDHAALKGHYLVLREWRDGHSVQV